MPGERADEAVGRREVHEVAERDHCDQHDERAWRTRWVRWTRGMLRILMKPGATLRRNPAVVSSIQGAAKMVNVTRAPWLPPTSKVSLTRATTPR